MLVTSDPSSRAKRFSQAIDEMPGMNGSKLAAALGVSTTAVSRWRRERDALSLERTIQIAPHLNRTVGWLWAGDDDWEPPNARGLVAEIREGIRAAEHGRTVEEQRLEDRLAAAEAELARHREALERAGFLDAVEAAVSESEAVSEEIRRERQRRRNG